MFFVISKLLAFLLQPINWVAVVLLYAFFTKREKYKRKLFVLGLCLFFFFNNHFIFNQVMCWWEPDPIAFKEVGHYDIGVLLGGYSNFFLVHNHDRHTFSERANRLTQTLELYKIGKIDKFLLTGGSGNVLEEVPSEADKAYHFLTTIGIPPEDIILEPDSRNTYENALFTKKILAEKYPNAKCLLITSAFHMTRSEGCFKKLGMDFDTFSVDHIGEHARFHPESLFLPDRLGFYKWEILVKEFVGNLMYWLKGYR